MHTSAKDHRTILMREGERVPQIASDYTKIIRRNRIASLESRKTKHKDKSPHSGSIVINIIIAPVITMITITKSTATTKTQDHASKLRKGSICQLYSPGKLSSAHTRAPSRRGVGDKLAKSCDSLGPFLIVGFGSLRGVPVRANSLSLFQWRQSDLTDPLSGTWMSSLG